VNGEALVCLGVWGTCSSYCACRRRRMLTALGSGRYTLVAAEAMPTVATVNDVADVSHLKAVVHEIGRR
jgi:hypothetical protein